MAKIFTAAIQKTAGTSYLEALRTIAVVDPSLFRDILRFARPLYDQEKRTYHTSAILDRVPEADDCSDSRLQQLMDENDSRQVLHVTFGKVLTARDSEGSYVFRQRILDCLSRHEDRHYEFVERHIRRHLAPFRH